ncbi:hypothetical protein [Bacillus sp. SD088]|uniref:hypothetical protein n=1 Tax=Bacillus sp. SD088 TaxID=2782012 RepID=UPI001A95E700|nr:hypothetical protein [Bacillus sp. SD088]MBO0993879.1 hypothetical protein [Bacillus sp. SD088]
MLKITIGQENQKSRTFHVPYFILRAGGRLATTKLLWKLIESRVKQKQEKTNSPSFSLDRIDWKDIQPIVKEIKNYQGLTIVDIQDKNGQAIKIEL